tara:strand:- start:4719 stop:4958 length:240 start_codon:yes stop_codon:yes gene_type:complete
MATQQTTTQIPETLTQQQAIGLLVQGVQIAQQRGAYNLEEAELIAIAIRAFKPAEEQPAQQPAAQQPATETATTTETSE